MYAQAPEKYTGALEQANKYQRILNMIASDIKKETEDRSGQAKAWNNTGQRCGNWARKGL